MTTSRAEEVYRHAIKYVTPFSTTLGHPHVIVPVGLAISNRTESQYQAWPIHSRRFREWLCDTFFERTGMWAGHQSVLSAMSVLAARARYGECHADVFARLGFTGDPYHPNAVYIHLANATGETIEITAHGNRMIPTPAGFSTSAPAPDCERCRFLTNDSAAPLPSPVHTSAPLAEQLEALLGLTGPNLHRIVIWLFAALRPSPPYPILFLTGPESSGKDDLAHTLRSLLDPTTAPLTAAPSSHRGLFNIALHNHVLAFESTARQLLPIAANIASLARGTGYAICSRNPFDEPQAFPLARPIIVASEFAPPDFTGNLLHIPLHSASPFELRHRPAAAAEILGTLCDAVTMALSRLATTPARHLGRHPGVHKWALAASPILGLTDEQIRLALAFNPLIEALQDLLTLHREWTGSPTQLYDQLRRQIPAVLPATPRVLSEQLNNLPLNLHGIHYHCTKSGGRRQIHVAQASDSCVQKHAAWPPTRTKCAA